MGDNGSSHSIMVEELTVLIEQMDRSLSKGKDPGHVLGALRGHHPDFRLSLKDAFKILMRRRQSGGAGVLGAHRMARRLLTL